MVINNPVYEEKWTIHSNTAEARSQREQSRFSSSDGKLYTTSDLKDLMNGAAFLSAGGGGPKHLGAELINSLNAEVAVVDLEQVVNDKYVVMSAYLGSPLAAAKLKANTFTSLQRSIKALEAANNINVSYVVPGELGAVNSIAPFLAAYDLGIPVVDADGCGRAVPVLAATTFGQNNDLISQFGAAVANDSDSNASHQSAVFTAQNIGEIQTVAISVLGSPAYGLLGAIATWVMTGAQLKSLAIPGGLQKCRTLGEQLRTNANPLSNVLELLKQFETPGRVLYNAKALKPLTYHVATRNAHDHAKLMLQVEDSDEIATIYMANENIIAYSNQQSEPVIMCPDMLCWLTPDGESMDNSELIERIEKKQLESVYAIGVQATQKIGLPGNSERVSFRDDPGILKSMLEVVAATGYSGSYKKLV